MTLQIPQDSQKKRSASREGCNLWSILSINWPTEGHSCYNRPRALIFNRNSKSLQGLMKFIVRLHAEITIKS